MKKNDNPFDTGGKRETVFRFDKALALMKRRDPQSFEDGFHWIRPHVGDCVPELLEAFRNESDPALRTSLLELIAAARSPAAMDVLVDSLRGDESLRYWAIRGLHDLATAEARTTLWEARSFEFATPAETARFRADLAGITGKNPHVRRPE